MKALYEKKNLRASHLAAAEKALQEKNMESYSTEMENVKNLNDEIAALEQLDVERGRFSESDPHMMNLHETQQMQKQESAVSNKLDAARSGNEYVNAWTKAMQNGVNLRDGRSNEAYRPLYNALTITGGAPEGSDGGFLTPVDFDNILTGKMKEFVRLADIFKVEEVTAYSGWRAIETTAGRTPLPKLTEASAIPKTDQPKFIKVPYTISDYGDRIAVSNDLLDDNTVGLMNYLAEWFSPRVVMTENALLLGLLNGLVAVDLAAGKEVAGLKKALNKDLNTAISKNAVILTNQSGFDFLDQQVDANGRALLAPNPADPDVYRFKGRRVIMADDDLLPNDTTSDTLFPLYIGYLKVFGTIFRRTALEFATTNVGGDAWGTNTTEARGIVRMDAQKMDEGAAIKRTIRGA